MKLTATPSSILSILCTLQLSFLTLHFSPCALCLLILCPRLKTPSAQYVLPSPAREYRLPSTLFPPPTCPPRGRCSGHRRSTDASRTTVRPARSDRKSTRLNSSHV